MLSKKEVKDIQSLCHKKQRDEQQLFIAEGPKIAEELLKSDFEIEKIYAEKEWLQKLEIPVINAAEVQPFELEKISQLQTPNKVVVIAKQKSITTQPVLKDQLTLVIDGIQDPGNMGTIIRIADWFGVRQIVASNDTVDMYNTKVIQATMGSFCRVNIWYKELDEFLNGVEIPIYGALLNGESIYNISKPKAGLIVIGNEGKGIRASVIEKITNPVTIPKIGEAESLNAAVATGIILSHLIGVQ